jgi:hypothetical protein
MSQHYRKSTEKSYEQADEYVNEQTMMLEEQRQREEERQMRMEEQQYIFEERQRLIEEQRYVSAPMGFSDRVVEEQRHEKKQDTPSLFFHVVSPQMLAAQAQHVRTAPDTCRCWHCMDAKPHAVSSAVKAAQESQRKRIALCSGAAARMRQVCAN